jgi:hypothetical protein
VFAGVFSSVVASLTYLASPVSLFSAGDGWKEGKDRRCAEAGIGDEPLITSYAFGVCMLLPKA